MKNRTGIRRVGKAVSRFTVDYMRRHRHPVNAALHIVGVPAAFYGFWLILRSLSLSRPQSSNLASGLVYVFFGYLLQYLGHRSQGNEVGEVILLKKVSRGLRARMSGSNVWQLLGGTSPTAKLTARPTARSTDSSKKDKASNGHHNGNGHKQPSLTSHSLVWWRKA
ncbi:hypothetical protein BH11CYA1_BH11CYA1_50950 [soil metagenome]